MSSGKWNRDRFFQRPSRQKKLNRAAIINGEFSHTPADDVNYTKAKMRREDDAFRGAMLDALDAGKERMPKVRDKNTDFHPVRITPDPSNGGCSSAQGWD